MGVHTGSCATHDHSLRYWTPHIIHHSPRAAPAPSCMTVCRIPTVMHPLSCTHHHAPTIMHPSSGWVRGRRDRQGNKKMGEGIQRWVRGHVYILSLHRNIYLIVNNPSQTRFKPKLNCCKPFQSVSVSVSKILPETEPFGFRFGEKWLKPNQTKLPQH